MKKILSLMALLPVVAQAAPRVVATCNNSALEVVQSPDIPENYTVNVNDAGVARFMVDQSKSCYDDQMEGSPYGSPSTYTVRVCRQFPWMVEAVESENKLIISDFRAYENDNFFTSGPGGVTLKRQGDGMKLEITGSYMPGSHSVVYYKVGEWFFEQCSFNR